MNDSYKKLAASILYVGIAALVAGLSTWLVGGFTNVTKILVIVGAALLLGYLAVSPEVITGAFRSRGLRYGGNSFAMAALVIVILGAGNWFTNTHSQSYDLTRDKLHTLTPQTLDILKNVHQDVKITGFFQTGQEQEAKDLLSQYAAHSGFIQYRFVDPDKDPATARQFGIVSYGTTVFQSGTNRKDVPTVGEQEYTSALLQVTNAERHKVYFVTGNGQPDPTASSDQQGFHEALLALQNDNYVVGTLDATASAVPEDAAAVILTPGTKPLLDSEKSALAAYLGKGGKMLVTSVGFGDNKDANDLLKPYGLQFMDGETVDAQSYVQQIGPEAPAMNRYTAPGNDILKNLTLTVYPLASGVQLGQPAPQGVALTALAKTSDQSWLRTHKDQNLAFQQGDTRGPITLVATAEGTPANLPSPSASGSTAASPSAVPTLPPASASAAASASGGASASAKPNAQATQTPTPIPQVTGSDVNLKGGTKIVAVADTYWMNDQFLDQIPGNHDLFLNAINHLVGNTALVNIPAKNLNDSQVNLLGSDARLIFFVTVLFIPLAVVVVGAVVWWGRR